MKNLRAQLRQILQSRVCLVGVGNVECGDDGFGVRLAEALRKSEIRGPKSERNPRPEARTFSCAGHFSDFDIRTSFGSRISGLGFATVVTAGTTPERHLGELANGDFDNVIFLDAVEFGGEPGAVVLLDSSEMAARFPQVSTHKLSLGLLAKMVEASSTAKVWLLGVQPASLKADEELSPAVQSSLEFLAELLQEEFEPQLAAIVGQEVCA
jgi:hydrogenase maturation protease